MRKPNAPPQFIAARRFLYKLARAYASRLSIAYTMQPMPAISANNIAPPSGSPSSQPISTPASTSRTLLTTIITMRNLFMPAPRFPSIRRHAQSLDERPGEILFLRQRLDVDVAQGTMRVHLLEGLLE